ncbi:WXG100 family type VII secretion target [Ilumatobacter coccineus]|jgi:uncharacterized protein YukE|uniref:WXG100 family type VII secretion target n=1 Tax=Ilumatobacter coccineus (strain NBRC 103263 / KCTC 29153 / YM16-304) TaxID=1313172 RepID=A0A6C7E605_ILUCY|nr:hypothetical protein [Ilumatobacter coccineus]BAN00645.1 hypothetical protein YM304_03310 [Ilumatobacter coccineus YM16-304]
MSGTHAVTPDELASLGGTLKAQIEAVNTIITSVDNPLGSIAWTGPAKEKFTQEWSGNFKSALVKLNEAFEVAGTDCERRAEGARIALG